MKSAKHPLLDVGVWKLGLHLQYCINYWSGYNILLAMHCGFQCYMWQSQVEIEHYSIAYFAHIAPFEAL